MKVTQAIETAAEIFRESGNLKPSHCDVRCLINDLTADDKEVYKKGYDQTRAWKQVRRKLGTPVTD